LIDPQRGFVPGIGPPRNRAGADVHLGERSARYLESVSDDLELKLEGLSDSLHQLQF
jgi:hypothetical protein